MIYIAVSMTTRHTKGSAIRRGRVFCLLLILVPSLAGAHTETDGIGGFASGFLHPLGGLDHIAAMVAVGSRGAHPGAPAMWLLPVIRVQVFA